MMKQISIALVCTVGGILAFANSTPAAIIYNNPGDVYSQNFDSLPNTPENTNLQTAATPKKWTDDTATPPGNDFSIVGWHLFHPLTQTEGGTNGNQRMRIGVGTANTGSFMSWGSTGSTERALGMLSSGTMSATGAGSFYGARITNNTGRKLASFTLSYTGEQWRDGGGPGVASIAQSITFDYDIGATAIQTGTYNSEPLLNFTSPTFGATTEENQANQATNDNWRNGNLVANRTAIGPVTVTGLNWQPGTDLWIRWTDINDASNDHGLGIDDLQFSAVIPEPTSLVLFVLAVVGACIVRRGR
jgi:hypothetical protein